LWNLVCLLRKRRWDMSVLCCAVCAP
jgi:hypothetical protein